MDQNKDSPNTILYETSKTLYPSKALGAVWFVVNKNNITWFTCKLLFDLMKYSHLYANAGDINYILGWFYGISTCSNRKTFGLQSPSPLSAPYASLEMECSSLNSILSKDKSPGRKRMLKHCNTKIPLRTTLAVKEQEWGHVGGLR